MAEPKERPLPYDVDIEQALLGAIMIDETVYWRISDQINANEFYDPLHQRLFEAITEIQNRNGATTPLTVKAAMEGDENFAAVGGVAYLTSLARGAPALPNVKDYARIIRLLARRRMLIRIGEDLVNAGFENSIDSDPVRVADEASDALYSATHGDDPGEGPVSIFDLAYRAAEQAERAHNDPRGVWLTSGLNTVDENLGGIYRGDLLTIGAATSMGKTSLLQLIGLANARKDHGVLIFSLEMSGVSLATRYIAQEAKVPSDRIRRGRTSTTELYALSQSPNKFADLRKHFKVDSTPNLSIAQMRARAKAFKRRTGNLALIIVDHLQFVRPADPRADEKEGAKQITRDLCTLGKELDVAVVLISHLTKEHERRASQRPMMSDLYGSAAIAQNSDSVWFVYRPHYYLARQNIGSDAGKDYDTWLRDTEKSKGWAEIFSTKVRMGQTNSVQVRFDEKFTRFYDPEDDGPVSAQDTLALAHGV